MAIATGVAMGAAAISGVALGLSCGARPEAKPRTAPGLQLQAPYPGPFPQAPQLCIFPAPARVPAAPQPAAPVPLGTAQEPLDHWRGFSMEEARAHADEAHGKATARAPGEVLAALQRGNARFWMNAAARPEKSAFERRALISKQFPSVAVLGCSDSRVPVEMVFDQGLGDLFVVRVAGNCLGTATKASLQYAVHHLKVKVIIVMGHEMCGAVKAAMLPRALLEQEPPELAMALKALKVGLDEDALGHLQDSRARDREAVTANVKQQVERLTQDDGIMSKVRDRELMILGAFYEISSGIVDFFFEVSGPEEDERSPDCSPPSRGVQSRFFPPALSSPRSGILQSRFTGSSTSHVPGIGSPSAQRRGAQPAAPAVGTPQPVLAGPVLA